MEGSRPRRQAWLPRAAGQVRLGELGDRSIIAGTVLPDHGFVEHAGLLSAGQVVAAGLFDQGAVVGVQVWGCGQQHGECEEWQAAAHGKVPFSRLVIDVARSERAGRFRIE